MQSIIEFLLTKRLEKPKYVKAKIGDYLHIDGSIDTTPNKDVIGVCVIATEQISGSPEARFVAIREDKAFECIWGPRKNLKLNRSYINGYENTEKIVKYGSEFRAANICINYNPGYGVGQWYLPASRELLALGAKVKEVNKYLEFIDEKYCIQQNLKYWTSTEYDKDEAVIMMGKYGTSATETKPFKCAVRPFILI